MAFKPFRKIRVAPDATITAKNINDVQDNISFALNQVLGKDALDCTILKNVTLLPGITNMVPHMLGRVLDGWYVVRNHGNYSFIVDQQDTNPSPDLLLYLTSPAQVTVDLLVF